MVGDRELLRARGGVGLRDNRNISFVEEKMDLLEFPSSTRAETIDIPSDSRERAKVGHGFREGSRVVRRRANRSARTSKHAFFPRDANASDE